MAVRYSTRTGASILIAGAAVGLLAGPERVVAQAAAGNEPLDAFVESLSEAGHRFLDVEAAIAEGYRKLGPDFPGMGEHWVHPGLVIAGRVDPRRPPVIAYTEIDGRRVLLGFAFTSVLGPGEEVPESVFPHEVWHDHSDGVDEEALLFSGPASMHAAGDGFRLSMVHVWTHRENPGGLLVQNNWALPFARLDLSVPAQVPSTAARALSLATDTGLGFYRRLLRDGVGIRGTDLDTAMDVLTSAAGDASRWASAHRGRALTASDLEPLSLIWKDVWAELDARLSREVMDSMEVLRGH